eukprot:gene22812-29983_t
MSPARSVSLSQAGAKLHRGFLQSCQARKASAEASPASPPPVQQRQRQRIDGYTPADYVQYSGEPHDRAHHQTGVRVNAPASVCYGIWHDWNRLVDFLDLVGQIGLDPDEEDMALFQCFYRWSQLPVLEIIMLIKRTIVVENELIEFESTWGMPANGSIQFIEQPSKKSPCGVRTSVIFTFDHAMPLLLLDLSIGPFSIETNLRDIFKENLAVFKELAESIASSPETAPPRTEGVSEPPLGIPGGIDGQMIMESAKSPKEIERVGWEFQEWMEARGKLEQDGGEWEEEEGEEVEGREMEGQEVEEEAVASGSGASAEQEAEQEASARASAEAAAGAAAEGGPEVETASSPAPKTQKKSTKTKKTSTKKSQTGKAAATS